MSETKKCNVHLPEFKAKVALEAVRGVMTINEIGQAYGVHSVQVSPWKKEIQEQAKTLFEGKRGPQPVAAIQGYLSSLVLDFVARQKIGGTNLNFFIVKQFPVHPLTATPKPTSLTLSPACWNSPTQPMRCRLGPMTWPHTTLVN